MSAPSRSEIAEMLVQLHDVMKAGNELSGVDYGLQLDGGNWDAPPEEIADWMLSRATKAPEQVTLTLRREVAESFRDYLTGDYLFLNAVQEAVETALESCEVQS